MIQPHKVPMFGRSQLHGHHFQTHKYLVPCRWLTGPITWAHHLQRPFIKKSPLVPDRAQPLEWTSNTVGGQKQQSRWACFTGPSLDTVLVAAAHHQSLSRSVAHLPGAAPSFNPLDKNGHLQSGVRVSPQVCWTFSRPVGHQQLQQQISIYCLRPWRTLSRASRLYRQRFDLA